MLSNFNLVFTVHVLSFFAIYSGESLADFFPCRRFEEYRVCGPKCPITCDTLNTNVCCDVTCAAGCFCRDGYMLVTADGPRKCVPISDCPKPGILEFKDWTLTVIESEKVIEIVILRQNGSYGEISVAWRTVEGTAQSFADFEPSNGVLVFPDGVTSQVIRVTITDNNLREADEYFSIILSDPTNKAEISPRRLEGIKIIIKDDDMNPGYIELQRERFTVKEDYGTLRVNVLRIGGTDGILRCKYKTVDTVAVTNLDYVPVQGDLVFNDGESTKTIDIVILNDDKRESLETFELQIYDITPGDGTINFRSLGTKLKAFIEITDDDMNPGYIELQREKFTVKEDYGTLRVNVLRIGGTDGILRCKYKTVDNVAVTNLDYVPVQGDLVFNDGESTKTIDIVILNDDKRESLETFELQIYDITPGDGTINFRSLGTKLKAFIEITDDDMNPGYIEVQREKFTVKEDYGTLRVNVLRIGGTDGILRCKYKTVDTVAVTNLDYVPVQGDLVFNDGESTKTIDIVILNDDKRESLETFELQIYDITPGDGTINFRSLGTKLKTVIEITDDDMNPGYIEVQREKFTVKEDYGTLRVNVLRIGGTDGILRCKYKTVDTVAVTNLDYVPVQGDLVFNDGESTKTIDIVILNDDKRESLETFELQIYDITPGDGTINFRSLGTKLKTVIEITDDDMKPGFIELKRDKFTVKEDYGTLRVNVMRIGGTDGILRCKYKTVDIVAVTNLDYIPVQGDLVFNDGEDTKSIDIVILNDDNRESLETFELQIYDITPGDGTINFRSLGTKLTAIISITDDDMKPGHLEFEQDSFTIKEDSGTLQVIVIRVGGTDGVLRMRYRTVDSSAVVQKDYRPLLGELVFNDGESRKTIEIAVVNDNIKQTMKTFQLEIFDITSEWGSIDFRSTRSKMATKVTIIDDDTKPGYLEFEQDSFTTREGSGTLQVTVIRVGGTDGVLRMRYRTVDISAVVQRDYAPLLGELVFNDGDSRKTIEIAVLNDNIKQTLKTFQLEMFDITSELGSIDFRSMRSRMATKITIIDDDTKPGYCEFERDSFTTREDSGTLHLTVIRVGGTDGVLRMRYRTVDSSAVVQRDYAPLLGELVFNDGESRKTIDIAVVNDNIKQTLKTFQLEIFDEISELGSIDFRSLRSRMTTKVTIIDDDTQTGYLEFERDTFTVREDAGTLRVTVIRVGGTDGVMRMRYKTIDIAAVVQRDYAPVLGELVFNDGEGRKTIDISILNDNVKGTLKTFQLQIVDISSEFGSLDFRSMRSRMTTLIKIIDDDMTPGYLEFEKSNFTAREDSGTLRVTVIRVGGTDGVMRMRYRTVDVTAVVQRDYAPVLGELVFNDGESRKTVDIVILNDNIKGTLRTFRLEIFDIASDYGNINFRSIGARMTAFVVIIDDDVTPGYLELSNTVVTIPESIGSITMNVNRRGGQDGEIRVRYRTVDGSATAPSDYQFRSGELVFGDGVTLQTVTIGIVNDGVAEPTESFRFELFDATVSPDLSFNFRSMSSRISTIVTILDDDDMKPGYLELEQTNITVREDFGTFQVTVVRVGGADGVLNLKYRTFDGTAVAQSDYLSVLGDLTFRNGETRKSISIVIINDDVRETTENFQLQLFDVAAGPGTLNFRPSGNRLTALITIIDDDDKAGVFDFQTVRISVPESVRSVALKIVRRDGSNGRVTLQVRTMSSTATEGVDYIHPPLTVVFPDGVVERTVRIQIVDDSVKEGDESFIVGIFNPSNGGILGRNKLVIVSIVDDDDPCIIRFRRRSGDFSREVGLAEIPVIRENRVDRRVSVYWKTEALSARDGENYRGSTGTLLTFEPGETLKTLKITLQINRQFQRSDLFDLILFDPSEGAVLGVPSKYTVQLSDFQKADPQFPAQGSVSSGSSQGWVSSGSAQGSMSSGSSQGWVSSGSSQGSMSSGSSQGSVSSGSYSLRISFPRRQIRVREDAGTIRISISRQGDTAVPFQVRIRTVDGSATAGKDFRRVSGPLSFQKGDVEVVIAIRIIDDDEVEPDETFTLQLLEPSLGTIPRELGTVTITIVDDDGEVGGRRDSSPVAPPPPKPPSGGHAGGGFGFLTKCPDHLIMKACADSCPPTCNSIRGKVPCNVNGGCIRACFCPEGLVKEDEMSERCVRPSECPGEFSPPLPPARPQRPKSQGIMGGFFQ